MAPDQNALHDEYVEKINMAVAEDRMDLVQDFERQYDEATRLRRG